MLIDVKYYIYLSKRYKTVILLFITEMSCYQLDDYTKFVFDGLDYSLPINIMELIEKLTIEINNIVPVPNHHIVEHKPKRDDYGNYKKSKSNHRNKTVSDEEWNSIRNFKVTKIDKKEGIEKSVNDIRVCLNKISVKNYDVHRETLLDLIGKTLEEIDSEESSEEEPEEQDTNTNTKKENNIKKIVTAIFDIACNNKINSELYATLYKELIQKYQIFNEIIVEYIEYYKENIREINYIDPNTDYDAFCNYNKSNDRRKSLSLFIVNLMKKGIITKKVVVDIIIFFQDIIFEYVDLPNKTNEVEEITENLFILVPSSKSICNDQIEWTMILDNINIISKMKPKDKQGVSSRAIFKYMDILDQMKK
jgi:hypothetical protein